LNQKYGSKALRMLAKMGGAGGFEIGQGIGKNN